MNLVIERDPFKAVSTTGWLLAGRMRLASLEEPWIENPKGPGGMRKSPTQAESCVPEGTYRMIPHNGAHFKGTWALHNPDLGVFATGEGAPDLAHWGRVAILLHPGNELSKTEGCVLTGLAHSIVNNRDWVTESQKAFRILADQLGPGEHELVIRRPT